MVAMPQVSGVPGKPGRRPKAVQLELPAPWAKTRAASREQTACMAAARGCYPRDSLPEIINAAVTQQSLLPCGEVCLCAPLAPAAASVASRAPCLRGDS